MSVTRTARGSFCRGVRYLDSLESLCSLDLRHDTLTRCLREFAACVDDFTRSNLRNNAQLDDVDTEELWLLNLDFYIGQAMNQTPVELGELSVAHRISVTKASVRKYLDFLITLFEYNILEIHSNKLKSLFPSGFHSLYDLRPLADDSDFRAALEGTASSLQEEVQKLEKSVRQYNGLLFCDLNAIRDLQLKRLTYHAKLAWLAVVAAVDELRCWHEVLYPGLSHSSFLREEQIPRIQCISHSDLRKLLGPYRFLPTFSMPVHEKITASHKTENSSQLRPTYNAVGLRDDVARMAFGRKKLAPTAQVEQLLKESMASNWGVDVR